MTLEGDNAAENFDFFAESYGWLPGKEGETGKVGYNHTLERHVNGRFKDYPWWNVHIRDKDMGIEMTPKLACNINSPVNMKM